MKSMAIKFSDKKNSDIMSVDALKVELFDCNIKNDTNMDKNVFQIQQIAP